LQATDGKSERRLLRMSELAALTEVRPAAIKFYIKQGLLPAPVKTSRNMAYYDDTFVEKIRLIKQLQTQHFLPLRVIKDILSQTSPNATLAETQALLEIRGYLLSHRAEGREPLTEEEVICRLNTYTEELEDLRRMGLVSPRETNGTRVYDGEDQELLEALENNRRLGFTREIGFQVKDLEIYLTVLEILATEEVKLLVARTAAKVSPEGIRELAGRGIRDLGPLIMMIRKKMILKVLSNLPASGQGASGTPEANGRAGGDGKPPETTPRRTNGVS
jgi:DNA-binding transcriptional MerR regulator